MMRSIVSWIVDGAGGRFEARRVLCGCGNRPHLPHDRLQVQAYTGRTENDEGG